MEGPGFREVAPRTEVEDSYRSVSLLLHESALMSPRFAGAVMI